MWGVFAKPRGSENLQTALEHIESKLGRKVGVTRRYLSWDDSIGSYDRWLVSTGRTPLISVKSARHNGGKVSWSSIANATPGSAVYAQIAEVGRRREVAEVAGVLHLQPRAGGGREQCLRHDAQYVAAWRKIVSVFRARGATNAKFLWIMTGWSFEVGSSDRRQAIKWYPGDNYVDALGNDEFNDYTCRADRKFDWRPLGSEIEPFRQFGLKHPGKELWLPEFGSVEDSKQAGRKASWLSDVRSLFEDPKYAQFKGIVYFSAYRAGTPCQWWLDSSSTAVSRLRRDGQGHLLHRHSLGARAGSRRCRRRMVGWRAWMPGDPAATLDSSGPRPAPPVPPVLDDSQQAVVDHRGRPVAGPRGAGHRQDDDARRGDRRPHREPRRLARLGPRPDLQPQGRRQLRDRVTARLGRTTSTTLCATFHSFAYGLIRKYSPAELYAGPLRLLSAPEQDVVLRELLTDAPESVRWPDSLRGALGTRGFAHEVQCRARPRPREGPRRRGAT